MLKYGYNRNNSISFFVNKSDNTEDKDEAISENKIKIIFYIFISGCKNKLKAIILKFAVTYEISVAIARRLKAKIYHGKDYGHIDYLNFRCR